MVALFCVCAARGCVVRQAVSALPVTSHLLEVIKSFEVRKKTKHEKKYEGEGRGRNGGEGKERTMAE